MTDRSRKILALVIGLVILLLDIASKKWISLHIPHVRSMQGFPYGGIPIFKDFLGIQFAIIHNTNKGAAWGILSQWQVYLVYLRIFMIIALSAFFVFNKKSSWDLPIALILAGAIGNVLDYFLYGHVIDMFHFVFWGYHYPTFNVADSAIFVGIVLLLFGPLFSRSLKHPEKI